MKMSKLGEDEFRKDDNDDDKVKIIRRASDIFKVCSCV
jgi:hypothetical protein